MTPRDYPEDLTDLLHLLVQKVRWFTEESIRRAHEVIDQEYRSSQAPAVDQVEEPKPAKKAPVKRPPKPRA